MALNVLHAIHDFLPRHVAGSEIYAFELCRELGRDHHVSVLAAEYDPARPHGELAWRVYDDLSVVELVNNWRGGSFAHTYDDPRLNEQIGHVLDAIQPDVVHAHSLLNLSLALPRLARERGVPIVATLHDYTLVCPSGGQRVHRRDAHVCRTIEPARCARCFSESPLATQMAYARVTGGAPARAGLHRLAAAARTWAPKTFAKVGETMGRIAAPQVTEREILARLGAARKVFDEVDLFIAPSPSIADEFVRLGLEASKIRVSDYGFVPFEPRVRQPGGSNGAKRPLRLGYVGTLVWHKGVHVLLDAVRALPAGTCEVRIFGDPGTFPDYTAELQRRAAGLPVRFMGGFTREQAAGVYEQFDVLVVPSLWLENSPLVIHEAFMAGVPVVAARIGGIADLVRDGENGWLYDSDRAGDLEAVLRRLIDRPDQVADRARARPVVKTIAEDARDFEAIYEALRRPVAAGLPA